MDELTEYLSSTEDGFWERIQSEARREAEHEPVLVSFLFASVLRHGNLEDAFGVILANKMQTPDMHAILLRDLINEALAGDVSIRASMRADLLAARTRDPSARGYMQPFLYFKDFTLFRRIALPTGCGCKGGMLWPLISRIASRRHLGSTFIPRLGLARAY
jgi:hypothetical protein